MRRVPLLLAFVWSLVISLYLLHAPLYSSVSTSVTASMAGMSTSIAPVNPRSTLLEVNGPRVLFILGLPVLLALLALLVPAAARARTAAIAGVLVGLFSLLGAMTVGLFYAPTALLVLLGAVLAERIRARPA